MRPHKHGAYMRQRSARVMHVRVKALPAVVVVVLVVALLVAVVPVLVAMVLVVVMLVAVRLSIVVVVADVVLPNHYFNTHNRLYLFYRYPQQFSAPQLHAIPLSASLPVRSRR